MSEFRSKCPRIGAPKEIHVLNQNSNRKVKRNLDCFLLDRTNDELVDSYHYNNLRSLISQKAIDDRILRTAIGQSPFIEDVGCGVGNSTRAISKLFPNVRVMGLDPSDSYVKKAREITDDESSKRVKFKKGGNLELLSAAPHGKTRPGIITTTNVLYNTEDLEQAFTEIRTTLPKGGVYVFQEIDPESKRAQQHTPTNHWMGRFAQGDRAYRKQVEFEFGQDMREIAKRYITMASYTGDEIKDTLKEAGFSENKIHLTSVDKIGMTVGYAVK